MAIPEKLINPVFVDGLGHNQGGVYSITVDEGQGRVFVLSAASSDYGLATFDLDGNLLNSAFAVWDGSSHSGWSGSNSPLGIAPGGSKIFWCGGTNGGTFIVYDRTTLAYIQHFAPGIGTFYDARHYLAVSADESWAATLAPQGGNTGSILYNVAANIVLPTVGGRTDITCITFDGSGDFYQGGTDGHVRQYSLAMVGGVITPTLVADHLPVGGGAYPLSITYMPQNGKFALWYSDGTAFIYDLSAISDTLSGLPTSITAGMNDANFWHGAGNNQMVFQTATGFAIADFFAGTVTSYARSLWTGNGSSNSLPIYESVRKAIWCAAYPSGIDILPLTLNQSPQPAPGASFRASTRIWGFPQ